MSFFTSIQENMLRQVVDKVLVIDAIEVRNSTGTIYYKTTLIANKRGDANVQQFKIFNDATELLCYVTSLPDVPVLLIVGSDRIVHKSLHDRADNTADLVAQIAPNAAPADFVVQETMLDKTSFFYSICRKTFLEKIVSALENVKDRIVDISMAPHPLFQTYNFLARDDMNGLLDFEYENYTFKIRDKGSEIVLFEKRLHQIPTDAGYMTIGNESIPVSSFMAFSQAVLFLLHPVNTGTGFYDPVQVNRMEFVFSKLIKPVLMLSLGMLLIVLAASSVYYTLMSRKYNALEEKLTLKKGVWQQLKNENSVQKERIQMFKKAGLLTSTKISYYAEELTSSIPDYIYLKSMNIHPQAIDGGEEFLFNDRFIVVEGNCYNLDDLGDWISAIKRHSWVENVVINEFKQPDQETIGNFKILITKKNER